MTDSATDTKTRIAVQEDLKEPSMFKIIYLNDNATSMEFVIESLVDIFDYSPVTAEKITIDINVINIKATSNIKCSG